MAVTEQGAIFEHILPKQKSLTSVTKGNFDMCYLDHSRLNIPPHD